MVIYQHWEEIQKLIDEALDLEPDLRQLFLETKCAENSQLLKEALDYLWFIEKAEEEQFLDQEKTMISSFISHYLNTDFKNRLAG